jgi:diguanylate cyclase (GGDEF)-like protein
MFVDLDHFKRVNDTLGHLAGDALLRDVAQRVRGLLPLQAVAGRFGGDEFVILMPEVADRQAVFNLAERVRAAVAEPLYVDGHEVKVTATIGLSVFPDDGQVSDELLRHADVALYVSKDQGRDGVGFYAGPERRTGAPKPPESDRSD